MATLPKPTPRQLAWQDAELSMFLHFGINTFTNREWGEGNEDPKLFNPERLDARQWVQTAKDAGFVYIILTAKHHDGFCLWPSKYTEHSVKNSLWREGRGDVMREFADACHSSGLKMGFYISPWDRNNPSYGTPEYNDYFVNQLTELLTGYGDVAEVWFDGACGEGPNGKRQVYDWQRYYSTIRRHRPKALIAISGPDVRWVGNEDGIAHETEWSSHDPDPTFHPDAKGQVWWPSETDVSIRPGWFWHKDQDEKVKSLDHLLKIYYESVGRNSVLLLNVPPNDEGLIAAQDVARLRTWRAVLDKTFGTDLAKGAKAVASSARKACSALYAVDGNKGTYWAPEDGAASPSLEIAFAAATAFDVIMLQEHIAEGQRVEEYRIEAFSEGQWREISKGTTIGHKKLDRIEPVTAGRVRLTILKSRACPLIGTLGLYHS